MIIDFHTHIYPPAVAQRAIEGAKGLLEAATDGTDLGLMAAMEIHGIDRALTLTLVNKPTNSRSINEWALTTKNEKLTPLGSFHPYEENPIETIDFIADMGFPGVKVHPEYQGFSFTDKSLEPCWQRCIERDLFVITHAGSDIKFTAPFRSNPKELLEFHQRYPKLRLVLAHMGSMDMWDDVERYILKQNVWLDLAMIGSFNFDPKLLKKMIQTHGVEKVLFGTDSPWADQKVAIDFVNSLGLTTNELDMIFAGNALKLLKN